MLWGGAAQRVAPRKLQLCCPHVWDEYLGEQLDGPRLVSEPGMCFPISTLKDGSAIGPVDLHSGSDVIIPKEALWALARLAPSSVHELDSIPGLGPWKRVKYGSELVSILSGLASQDA